MAPPNFNSHNSKLNQLNCPPWHVVEKKIQEEINWIRDSIETFTKKEKYSPVACRECLMRRIAILIVSGKVKATEITKSPSLQSFWKIKDKTKRINKIKIFHGKDWHRKTIEQIENHFLSFGCKIVREPTLYWGRADLGVYKREEYDLLIEVGTTSFYKLWINLEMAKNSIYLIVINDNKLIEFVCK